jgi:hypothetical protein
MVAWLCCFGPVARQNIMVGSRSAHFTAGKKRWQGERERERERDQISNERAHPQCPVSLPLGSTSSRFYNVPIASHTSNQTFTTSPLGNTSAPNHITMFPKLWIPLSISCILWRLQLQDKCLYFSDSFFSVKFFN